MILSWSSRLCWLFLLLAAPRFCVGQLCDFLLEAGESPDPHTAPERIDLDQIGAVAQYANMADVKLQPIENLLPRLAPDVRKSAQDTIAADGGGGAVFCPGAGRYIFYSKLKFDSPDNLPLFFMLAHELAHQVKDHVLKGPDRRWEEEADTLAAEWVTVLKRRAAEPDTANQGDVYDRLIIAFHALGLAPQGDDLHPSACEREGDIAEGYNKAVAKDGLPPKRPKACNVCRTYLGDSLALLTQRRVEKNARLIEDDVVLCPGGPSGLPSEFRRDIDGMCPISELDVATRLTWDNIDVCNLMSKEN